MNNETIDTNPKTMEGLIRNQEILNKSMQELGDLIKSLNPANQYKTENNNE
jgi:hypothetical protein